MTWKYVEIWLYGDKSNKVILKLKIKLYNVLVSELYQIWDCSPISSNSHLQFPNCRFDL